MVQSVVSEDGVMTYFQSFIIAIFVLTFLTLSGKWTIDLSGTSEVRDMVIIVFFVWVIHCVTIILPIWGISNLVRYAFF